MVAYWLSAGKRWERPDEVWRGYPANHRWPLYDNVAIPTRTIPDYKTEEFREALAIWSKLRAGYGWPYAGGWMEQPAWVVACVDAIDAADAIRTAEERKLREGNRWR
jgi:hypothetical protein